MPAGIYKHKKGFKHSEETKRKLRIFNTGKKHSEETKIKIRRNRHTEEAKRKIGKASKGRNLGEKSANWRGGLKLKPYSVDWTITLRRSIRERDEYICQLCNKEQGDRAFSIHHIDYNKLNSNPENLITLCASCHQKTNFNKKYWIKYIGLRRK